MTQFRRDGFLLSQVLWEGAHDSIPGYGADLVHVAACSLSSFLCRPSSPSCLSQGASWNFRAALRCFTSRLPANAFIRDPSILPSFQASDTWTYAACAPFCRLVHPILKLQVRSCCYFTIGSDSRKKFVLLCFLKIFKDHLLSAFLELLVDRRCSDTLSF